MNKGINKFVIPYVRLRNSFYATQVDLAMSVCVKLALVQNT